MKIRTMITIRGQVQGVSFRYYTRYTADRLGVQGWVKNLPDGSVQGCFEGEEEAVRSLIDWCRTGPPAARVDEVQVEDERYTGELVGFEVRH
ncbi:acylphosphatase [Geobacter sp. DSM 9736]|uniref:acylphosphatase n=1 Tax=Geobacter sp. DSM 9736 TaxID=1277350 RepID=UPI000B4FE8BE|nr:acylphosphatase [Geobacter sp. DSM 9736]SNB47988.1 acylphosphatase [Geobacter sp. DSM 9736]